MTQLTHFKKLQNPDYIGAHALEPGKDMILTIKSVAMEMITGTGGKKEEAMVIHFTEQVKPMICNVTNAKAIAKLHKTPYIEQWAGKKIQLYSKKVNAFGEEVDALRVRDFVKQDEIDVTSALMKLEGCATLEDLRKCFIGLNKAEQSNQEVKDLTERLKKELK